MATNPIRNPMLTTYEKAVKDADWLAEAPKFQAAVEMGRVLAKQVDDLTSAVDPEAVKQLNMRVLPNFHRTLHGLGLTPEGYAKMTGANGTTPRPGASGAGMEPEEPMRSEVKGTNPLDRMAADLENVVSLHRNQ